MESNNIVTAPQIRDVPGLLAHWKMTHAGGTDAFFRFMTPPSAWRAEFLAGCKAVYESHGSVVSNVFDMRADG